jgi:hypothetical protein
MGNREGEKTRFGRPREPAKPSGRPCYFAGAGLAVFAVAAATFFVLFLLFLLCFLLTFLVLLVLVAAGFSGVVAACWAANAEPKTMAAPSIKAESFFMIISFSFRGLSLPSLKETVSILEFL